MSGAAIVLFGAMTWFFLFRPFVSTDDARVAATLVRLATIAVKAGTKTHAETLDAELELFRARAGLIRAQIDASEALANLELALGYRL